jgi:ATP:ADP antiporter, AAA family
MPTLSGTDRTQQTFLLGSGLMVAHQVAGKAVRDGLFLSRFSPSDLPKVIVCAALLSVLLGIGFSRVLSRYGPMRLVPAAFALGSVLHLLEYAFLRNSPHPSSGVLVTLVYLHLVGVGAVLLSSFWSVANEVFDPRRAKRVFGKIAGAGTAGGIVGGALAERGAALFGPNALLLLLAALHFGVWLTLSRLPADRVTEVEESAPEDSWQAARDAFRQAPFLVNLALLVLIGTVSATLLDFLFKSGAAATYGKGPQLTRYFAIFYTGSQVLTFGVQTFLTPVALRRLGLGRTMQGHSTAVAVGAGAALFLPRLFAVPMARALELVMRGSFLRSSYELFFTPVPPREKRATKMFIDVSCDRMGDAAGAGVLQLLLLLGPARAGTPILVLTMGLAGLAFWLTKRMDHAYSSVLEHGLLSRAVALQETDVEDSTTLAALMQSSESGKETPRPAPVSPPSPPAVAKVRAHDALLDRFADLRSGVPQRIQDALDAEQPFDSALVPLAIRLLAWDAASDSARAFLLRNAHRSVGQLVDALLDEEQDVAVRRRIPHILAYSTSQRAVNGLTEALSDRRFEVRFHSSRALEFLHRMGEGLRFDSAALLESVERELSTSHSIWQGRKLLESGESGDVQYRFLDEVLRDRADKSLEYLFSLLAIMIPAEPLKVAFRALHSQDRILRGLALEFLESHLSSDAVSRLRRLVEPSTEAPAARRDAPQVLQELMNSQESILSIVRNASAGAPARVVTQRRTRPA